ncbi:MAG: hypothetical protein WA580_04685 [Acidimicrobiales bacterium]
MHAKPWQRYLMAGSLIALGIALIAFGESKGIVLALVGVLVVFEGVRHRRNSRREP